MRTEEQISTLLNTCIDPQLDLNAKEMNLRYHIESDGSKTLVRIIAGFPIALLEAGFKQRAQAMLEEYMPGQHITVAIEQQIKAHKTQFPGKGLRGVKNTIAIASGKGGVGKSTVTVNLAIALARMGARVGILDADIYGPSIPLMLGHKKEIELRGDNYIPLEAHGVHAMSIGYLTENDGALIWRGPMLAKALIQMLDLTLWDALDYLFIDLPPGTGDIQLSLVQKIPLTAAIIVTTPQNVATLDAEKGMILFNKTNIALLGLVENMATYRCSHCGQEEAVFGQGGAEQLCTTYKTPLLGQLPLNGLIRAHCDAAAPTASQPQDALVDSFMKTALRAAIALSNQPINYANKFPPVVVE